MCDMTSASEDRQGGVVKVEIRGLRKFSGELKTLQMGFGSHIDSVCFPFVFVGLQLSFHCSISSSLTCPL